MQGFDIVWILKSLPAIIIGLTVHEYAHAYIAFRLGDPTAKDSGRMTLNPLKHIDPLGFVLIVIAGFGWAKPVTFNPDNLRRKHRDEILIAIAGPFSNLLVGLLFFALARAFYFYPFFSDTDSGLAFVKTIILSGVINFGLFVFNLIPLPPLDGSHLYMTFIKTVNPQLMKRIYQYGTYALLIIVIIQNRTDITILPVSPIINAMTTALIGILRF